MDIATLRAIQDRVRADRELLLESPVGRISEDNVFRLALLQSLWDRESLIVELETRSPFKDFIEKQ
jgi:hypothetical protein